MVYAMLTVAFHLLVYFAHQPRGLFGKIFGFIPVVIIVALLVLKPLTSMMNWYYTQNYFINRSLPGPPAGLKQVGCMMVLVCCVVRYCKHLLLACLGAILVVLLVTLLHGEYYNCHMHHHHSSLSHSASLRAA